MQMASFLATAVAEIVLGMSNGQATLPSWRVNLAIISRSASFFIPFAGVVFQ
jgi:hypothetical protein